MKPIFFIALIGILYVLYSPWSAHADEWMTPTPTTITSPSGGFTATISPGEATAGGRPASLVITGPGGSSTLALSNEWMPVDAIVFDDGSVLTLDQWHSMGYGEVATLYEPDGQVRWRKNLEALIGKEAAAAAPHSTSSIWWRKTPLEWSLGPRAEHVLVTLHDEHKLQIRLLDAQTKRVEVTDLGDDPKRLQKRAESLLGEQKYAEAAALFERAVTHAPDDLQLVTQLASALSKAGRAKDAARFLEDALKRPVAQNVSVDDGYVIINLRVELARAQQSLGDVAAAEKNLRTATSIETSTPYFLPTQMLARMLCQGGKKSACFQVLSDHLDRYTTGARAQKTDSRSIAYVANDVGGFFLGEGKTKEALDAYLRGYREDEVTGPFLYETLAELHEKLGDYPAAIKVHQQLLVYYRSISPNAFADSVKRSTDALKRLQTP